MDDLGAISETAGAAAAELAVAALIERGHKIKPCPNCGAPVTGAYCAQCGQSVETHRRSVVHLLHDLVKDIASFDSRILRTARALLFEPGELPLAFRHGRTQRYVPAVRLYLFVSLLFFLFLSATGIALMQFNLTIDSYKLTTDNAGNVIKVRGTERTILQGLKATAKGNVYVDGGESAGRIPIPGMKADGSVTNTITDRPMFFQRIGRYHPKVTPEVKTALAKFESETLADAKKSNESGGWLMTDIFTTLQKLEADPAALNGPLMTWIPRILFLLLPLFALLLGAFYWRQRKQFYFVDHLVFSLTMHTFAFAVLIVAASAAQFISGTWVVGFVFLAMGIYLLLSLKRFYGQSWAWTNLKFVGIGVIYPTFFVGPSLVAAIAASAIAA